MAAHRVCIKIPTQIFIDRTFLENKIFQFLNKISKPKKFIIYRRDRHQIIIMLNYSNTLDFEKF